MKYWYGKLFEFMHSISIIYLLMSLTNKVTITSIAVIFTVTIALNRSGLIKLVLRET